MEEMGLKKGGKERRGIVEDRLMKVEKRIEMREREERKRNIIITGVE